MPNTVKQPDRESPGAGKPDEPAEKQKRPRKRSPNYPVLSLEGAIQRTRTLYDKEGVHYMPVRLAHTHWGYKPQGSVADQTTAALRAYGLLDVDGAGDERRVRVSAIGERIIRSAPNQDELIREAALRPAIHRELWNRYSQTGLPSDENIRTYLEWDREAGTFNKDVVDGVITRFRETIVFAKLQAGDIFGAERIQGVDDNARDVASDVAPLERLSAQAAKKTTPMPPTGNQDVFTLAEGQAVLAWPANLSADSFQDLEDWLKLALRKIKRSVGDATPRPTPPEQD